MDRRDLMTIGRFASLTDLPPRLLRKLDERRILVPAETDPDTGYRYYTAAQTRVAGLVHLGRQLGLPLDEIAQLVALEDDAELRRRLAEHRGRLAGRLEQQARSLRLLDQELARGGRLLEYKVAVKVLPPLLVMGARGSSPRTHPHDPWALEAALHAAGDRASVHLESLGETPDPHPIIAYLSDLASDGDMDFEVCFPIERALPDGRGARCHELPATRVAWTTYHGGYDTIWSAHLSLRAWAADHGHPAGGLSRERGLVDQGDTPDETLWVTEIALTLPA